MPQRRSRPGFLSSNKPLRFFIGDFANYRPALVGAHSSSVTSNLHHEIACELAILLVGGCKRGFNSLKNYLSWQVLFRRQLC